MSKSRPLISFIVPVYNAESTVARCVNSITRQSYSDIEIILVNNCSADASLQVCNKLANKDSRVKVLDIPEKGVSAARNKGIDVAEGTFVSFVDADDWIDFNVCENFVNKNEKSRYDLFCYSAKYRKKNIMTTSYLFEDDINLFSPSQKENLQIKVLAPQAPILKFKMNTRFAGSACGKFYKRNVLLENHLRFATETIISEDVLFNTLSLDFFHRIGYTKQSFYHYEQSEGSAQNRYRPNSDKYFVFIIEKIQEWLRKTKKKQDLVDAANCLFVHYLFGFLKEDLFHKDNKVVYTEKLKKLRNILSDDIWSNIIELAKLKYFNTPEKLLIWLLNRKYCSIVSLLMKIYC